MVLKPVWIKTELKRLYGNAYLVRGNEEGVDFNGNGVLDEKEKISAFNNNTLPGNDVFKIGDWTDWLSYYKFHHDKIKARVSKGILGYKNALFWSTKFSKKNRIHLVTAIESHVMSASDVRSAYMSTFFLLKTSRRAAAIINKARKETRQTLVKQLGAKSKMVRTRDAAAKFVAINSAIYSLGFRRVVLSPHNLYIKDINSRIIDCDSSSYVAMAIGDEEGWPIFPVAVPGHIFPRWHDRSDPNNEIRLNAELNYPRPLFQDNSFYIKRFKLNSITLRKRRIGNRTNPIYMGSMDNRALIALVLKNTAVSLTSSGRHAEALTFAERAVKVDPTCVDAWVEVGVIKTRLGKKREAIKAFRKGIELDPNHDKAYRNIGYVYMTMDKYEKAIAPLTRAIRLKPKNANYRWYRAAAYRMVGRRSLYRRDVKEARRLGGRPPAEVRRNIRFFDAIPEFKLGMQAHIGLNKQSKISALGGRLNLNLDWKLYESDGGFRLGALTSIGYNFGDRHHMFDFSAGPTVGFEYGIMLLKYKTLFGYNVRAMGDLSTAPLTEGAFIRHGLTASFHIANKCYLSAFLELDHQLSGERNLAVSTGLGVGMLF